MVTPPQMRPARRQIGPNQVTTDGASKHSATILKKLQPDITNRTHKMALMPRVQKSAFIPIDEYSKSGSESFCQVIKNHYYLNHSGTVSPQQ
jgi:hypothetical protein